MTRPEDDIDNRLPVWGALSELFLDTELEDRDIERIAEVLAGSPYGVRELEVILYEEVYPVCIFNLFSPAGEWAGFDEEWLRTRILNRNRLIAKLPKLNKWMIREPWERAKANMGKHQHPNL